MELNEKRRESRRQLELIAYVQVTESEVHESGLTFSATVVELSAGGLRIRSSQLLEEGRVELFVATPTGDRLYLAAEVRWCSIDMEDEDDHEAGLELIEDPDTDVVEWRRFQEAVNGNQKRARETGGLC